VSAIDQLERGLRDLGWTLSADDIKRERRTPVTVVAQLRQAVARKREFLAGHTFKPGTCGEETHERVSAWVLRADLLLSTQPTADEGGHS
jgi:hypothetical protein